MSNEIITIDNIKEYKKKLDDNFPSNEPLFLTNFNRGWAATSNNISVGTIPSDRHISKVALCFQGNVQPAVNDLNFQLYIGSTQVCNYNAYFNNGLTGTTAATGSGQEASILVFKDVSIDAKNGDVVELRLKERVQTISTWKVRYCGISVALR